MKTSKVYVLAILLLLFSCSEILFEDEIYVYFNNFNSEDYSGLDSVYISEFDGSQVMGNFNNSGFSLKLNDLPEHNFVRLTFDLYIHDSWDGNSHNRQLNIPDHDAWIIEFDPHVRDYPDRPIYETTFSNRLCIPAWCTPQSYPNQFHFDHNARTDAETRSTFGRCLWNSSPIGTSIYKMNLIFPHNKPDVVIAFYDRLKQEIDFPAICEESWSLDNLSVSVISSK